MQSHFTATGMGQAPERQVVTRKTRPSGRQEKAEGHPRRGAGNLGQGDVMKARGRGVLRRE